MLILGLTGSIGMGKTTTAQMFRDAGVPVHDSDAAVHELYESEAVGPIASLFPDVVANGAVSRPALSAIVLSDPAALKRLEHVVHPLVAEHRQKFIENARAKGAALCVADIPLLFESGSADAVDVIVVVTASPLVQKRRVMGRPGMTDDKFEAILERQIDDSSKRRMAHFVVDTSNGFEAARRQVTGIIRALCR